MHGHRSCVHWRRAATWAGVVLLAGCSAGCPAAPSPRATPLRAAEVAVEPLAEHVAAAVDSGGHVVVGDALGAGLLGATARVPGVLRDGTTFAGRGVVALDTGVFVVQGDALLLSPLSAALPDAPTFVEGCGDALYIGASGSLFRYRQGDAPVLEELSIRAPAVSASCTPGAVLYLVTDDGAVVAVASRGPAAELSTIPGAQAAALLGGELVVHDGSALWGPVGEPLLQDATAFVAAGRAAFGLIDDAVFFADRSPEPLRADGVTGSALFGAGDATALLVTSEGVLARLRIGRALYVRGLPNGSVVEGDATVEFTASHPAATEGITVLLDGVSAPAAPVEPGEPARVALVLHGPALAVGPHVVEAEATFTDGAAPQRVEVGFFAGAATIPTYTHDVRPLYEAVCSRCHSVQGGAHLLDTSDKWRAEIGDIVAALDSGLMPPDFELERTQKNAVRLWAATGMEE